MRNEANARDFVETTSDTTFSHHLQSNRIQWLLRDIWLMRTGCLFQSLGQIAILIQKGYNILPCLTTLLFVRITPDVWMNGFVFCRLSVRLWPHHLHSEYRSTRFLWLTAKLSDSFFSSIFCWWARIPPHRVECSAFILKRVASVDRLKSPNDRTDWVDCWIHAHSSFRPQLPIHATPFNLLLPSTLLNWFRWKIQRFN